MSDVPSSRRNRSLCWRRTSSTACRSTSTDVQTCGAIRSDSVIRSAMARRMRDSGCTSSLGPAGLARRRTGLKGLKGLEELKGPGVLAGARSARAMAASTSSRVIRPVAPEPWIAPRSMPCRAASFLTIGESLARPFPAGADGTEVISDGEA